MLSLRLTRLLLCVLLALAACTPRANVSPKTAPPDVGKRVTVLVGTSRTRTADGGYESSGRGPIHFGSFEISIPPQHEDGRVEVGGESPDPQRHFLTRSIQPLSAGGFRGEVARRLAANPSYNGEAFVFIHGFNNTMGDGVFRTAQIFSDLEIGALPVHYAWPSGGSPLGYPFDRDSALYARNGLQDLVEELVAGGASSIILVAHSMGSHVTMETLRQMSLAGRGPDWDKIGGVALLAPDIDIDLFHAQATDIGTLPKPFLIFASERDPALRLSARLTGQTARLGNIGSASDVATLDVTVIDVSQFRDTRNVHLTAVASPTLIKLASSTEAIGEAFRSDSVARTGLLPGTIITVQNATEVILDPASALQAADR